MIKAILFDLDDTLYDCTGSLVEVARRRAARALVAAGLQMSLQEAYDLQIKLQEAHGPRFNVFERIAENHGLDDSAIHHALEAYHNDEVEGIKLFEDVERTLRALREEGYKLSLISTGVHNRQEKKVELLGLKPLFDHIEINDSERGYLTQQVFEHVLSRFRVRGDEAVVVGDRIYSELRIGKTYGMTTVQMLHGRFKDLIPETTEERPDYRISRISELTNVLHLADRQRNIGQPRVAAIGGGTGLPIVLTGMRRFTHNLTAIVTVTDSGRSSGRLRNELGILPPGDIRNCLVALSESDKLMNDLFQYRFGEGILEGMSFGNLLLAAMAKVTGNFETGLREVSGILKIVGNVLPSTLTDTHICARLRDGSVIEEEFNMRQVNKSAPIEEVFLRDKDVAPSEEALEAIENADLIVLGPGSLFTSVISNLLVPGIPGAIKAASAKKVYISNIVTQPGQTEGFTADDHVNTIERYLGVDVLDAVIVNNYVPPDEVMAAYERDGAALVLPDDKLRSRTKLRIIEENLVEDIHSKRILWEKQDLLRHDPTKLAFLLVRLLSTH
ncbi:MAG: uridine diphosphate-N-acetylglucosamine-binding protein YvcK [Planctomycetota bacterium]|nr:uridine diphosphate-N-acetylglucosamine-binding protein YvcK [Planctomycetota bacterium]MDA1143265.1 uridine diphosphate-N-acetylglucosamine-binding protein YvcK [Planctomycetota bacterium]